jgi:hypothetical protein
MTKTNDTIAAIAGLYHHPGFINKHIPYSTGVINLMQ